MIGSYKMVKIELSIYLWLTGSVLRGAKRCCCCVSASSPYFLSDYHNHQASTVVQPKSIKMKWQVVLALVAAAEAALRFGCSTLSIQRLDPIVEPGKIPSSHLHQIVGGNAFNATMEGDVGERGTCTTCTFSEDFSNYWTAVVFFKHPTNGSYKRLPLMQNTALPNGINGGMTVYYTQQDFYSNGNQKITAFKPVSTAREPAIPAVRDRY